MHHITFTSATVRENNPLLEVFDVGINGCLDAHDFDRKFKHDIGPIIILEEHVLSLPFCTV